MDRWNWNLWLRGGHVFQVLPQGSRKLGLYSEEAWPYGTTDLLSPFWSVNPRPQILLTPNYHQGMPQGTHDSVAIPPSSENLLKFHVPFCYLLALKRLSETKLFNLEPWSLPMALAPWIWSHLCLWSCLLWGSQGSIPFKGKMFESFFLLWITAILKWFEGKKNR